MEKNRLILSLLENIKVLVEKTYPKDKKLIGLLSEALHLICWKVYENEIDAHGTGHQRH